MSFGASSGAGQSGKSWEALRIAWHALSSGVVSDALLGAHQDNCVASASCDYGVGTHTYDYNANLTFPADPWRDLPGISVDDPDDQPIAP